MLNRIRRFALILRSVAAMLSIKTTFIGGTAMGLVKEFKDFAMRGNVVDLAVGVVIGGAFGKIVASLVNDIIMPVIGKLTGGVNFADKFLSLDGNQYESLKVAKEKGAAVLGYGAFIQSVVDFMIVAAAIFVVIKLMNTAKKRFERNEAAQPAAPAPTPEDVLLLREIRDSLRQR